jgi:hypothetical protein
LEAHLTSQLQKTSFVNAQTVLASPIVDKTAALTAKSGTRITPLVPLSPSPHPVLICPAVSNPRHRGKTCIK